MGYTAVWAGLVLGPGGLASLMFMPVAGALMKKGGSPKAILAAGLAIMAFALYLMSNFDLQASFTSIAWPRIVQGFGLGLFFVPLASSAYVNIPKEKMGNASGVFNLLRNLGGSFGVAVSATLLAQRSQLHQSFLVENVTPFNPALRAYAARIPRVLPGGERGAADSPVVLAGIYREVLRQANMLAFNDVFWLFAWLTVFMIPLTLFMRGRRGAAADIPEGLH
jgi:DHA2 family multidrug resistance protein